MTGIVVVTWNSAEVIGACLDACLSFADVAIVVVDNASTDGTVEAVGKRDRVRLIANSENRGFAGAVNQGVAELACPAVLLLNPDAQPLRGLDRLAAAALEDRVGAAGGQLLDPDGRNQDGFNVRAFPTAWTLAFEVMGLNRLFPWNPVNRRYRRIARTGGEVDQPAGAFLMLNREAWRETGGLDESYWPAWFEDVDFCLRLKQAGYRVLYVPEASACHIGGHSASRLSWESRQLFWYGSLLRYSAMHFPAAGRKLVSAAVMTACLPRSVLCLAGSGGLAAARVYSKVFRIAFGYWRNGRYFSELAARSS